jgi:hypothetical protein
MQLLTAGISFILLFFFCPCFAYTEIVVYDNVALKGEEVMLQAETRGKVFRKGGELVEFHVNGRPIGKRLSGGDGFAFLAFTPRRGGLYRITAQSGQEEGKGLLLTLQKSDTIVFIDIDGSLIEGLFSKSPRKNSQKMVERIAKKFPVVCLQTGFAGITELKRWLKTNGLPDMPVLAWKEGDIFTEIHDKGLGIHAVIGSEPVIAAARRYRPSIFSFQDTEDAEPVNDWDEIARKLLSTKTKKGPR